MKPTFFYDKHGKPIMVRLSMEDFNNFYNELKKLSADAKKPTSGKKVLTSSGIAEGDDRNILTGHTTSSLAVSAVAHKSEGWIRVFKLGKLRRAGAIFLNELRQKVEKVAR
jgi:hypothetical protein